MKSNIIDLSAYSGLKVSLYKHGDLGYIVRKEAKKITQNNRLRKQYQKHLFFANLKTDLFRVPTVIGKGYKNSLFFYEYKYAEGVTLLNFIQKKSNQEINTLLAKIIDILKYLSLHSNSFEKINANSSFTSLLEDKIKKNFKKVKIPKTLKDSILKQLKEMPEHKNQTLSHGDLSFDNVIVDKEMNITLIDFMDLFSPHYWFDISKMFQDIDGGWSEIRHGIILSKEKIKNIRTYFISRIDIFDKEYLNYHSFLMAVVFLRILPYAKNELDRKKILNKIRMFINN